MRGLTSLISQKLKVCASVLFLFSLPSWGQQDLVPIAETTLEAFSRITAYESVQSSLQRIIETEPDTIQEQFRITEIPAPPYKEQERAAYYLGQMRSRGLQNAYIDSEGNVIGVRKGTGEGPIFLISAHLDTVFPEGTDTTVKLRGGRYYAPGIGDDTRGLAALLSVIDTLNASGIETIGDVIFAGNVGEEGTGDLRGIKAIFRDNPSIDGYVSIDGTLLRRITNGGTGSRRFEFAFQGPGGHSFGAFGRASAIHAMGRAIAKISDLETPSVPKTTFTIGTVRGGTSVNSIAADATFAIDMRSNDPNELSILESRVKAAALEAVEEENQRWNNGKIFVDFNLIGDRPVGKTAPESPIVQVAALTFDELGIELQELGTSSTDSNLPMSLDIPAITIAGGGRGGGAHSPGEWFIPTNSHLGPQAALLITLSMVGIKNISPPLLEKIDK